MLRLQDISIARGTRILYSNVSLVTSPGERIGLVGANGSGKTSLFASILGELSPESGDITRPDPLRISQVAQRITSTDLRAIDFVLEGHEPLVLAKAALAQAETGHDDMVLAHCLSALAELNEGAIQALARTILHGLGFSDSDGSRPVSDFSGGWRNRLALARALMKPSDLLLLDEPTNHLDLDSVIWLEAWLRRQQATVIIISHDREFLDRAVQTIWSVEDGSIHRYSGNYSNFEEQRAEKLRLQAAAAKAYERTSTHLQSFIDRFRAKATKAKQAQSRMKMLEKLQAVEPVRASSEWRFEFPKPVKIPQHLLDAQNLQVGYGDTTILRKVRLNIPCGARFGILGVNGAGKSTLIKALTGTLPIQGGEIRQGQGLEIGYFAQHQLDQLREDESPLDHLRRIAPQIREQELRNFLGMYRFSGDMATHLVGPMSGGEKARLALALIAWNKPNLLVLDEPTNHLDMETREALTMALSSYEGAVLLVSHDRHLLRATCDDLWLVHEGSVTPFDGDLDDYAALVLNARKDNLSTSSQESDTAGINRKEQRKNEAAERVRINSARKPLKKQLDQVDKEISSLSLQLKALDSKLADSSFYEGDQEEVASVLKTRGEVATRLDELEMRWLDLSEKIDAIC